MSVLSVDINSIPSCLQLPSNESVSGASVTSGKSVGRCEQYVSQDSPAFNSYMLTRDPEDIGPSDSASNDPLTKFSIRSNAVKTNADNGVSMDGNQSSKPNSVVGEDQPDLALSKGLKLQAHLDTGVSVSTTSNESEKKKKYMKKKQKEKSVKGSGSKSKAGQYPKIDADSDSENFCFTDSSDDDNLCECSDDCIYKQKYFKLKNRMKKVAMQLIKDL
nr:NSP5 [Rotavirus A]